MRIAILLLLIGSIVAQASARRSATCSSYLDPHIITFDGKSYGFQYAGDQYIMFDNLKDTRVTVGYNRCGMGSCNCAVYIKSDRKVIFADFCEVRDPTLPASQFYTMDTRRGVVGLDALKPVENCKILSGQVDNDHPFWNDVPVIAERFKCARLQGSGQVITYLIRTVERNPADGIQVKVQLGKQNLPRIDLKIWESDHYNATGGLCGRWDDSRTRELYVLDKDGIEDFTETNIDTFREYWRLHSQYNKVNAIEHEQSKRCPECQVISERSIYCPCDNFDMFDNMVNNYNLPKPNRNTYCMVPWDRCLCLKWRDENCTAPTTTPSPGTTTPVPIISPGELDICLENCQNAFNNHTVISGLLGQNCFEIPETSLNACAEDSCFNPDRPDHFINEAINNLIETTIQSILANQTNCTLPHFCGPNACSGNGQCVQNTECFDDKGPLTKSGIVAENCLMTHICECDYPYGDRDCSLDLTVIPEFELDKKCCDLRNEDCSTINIIGSGFSTVNPLEVKIEYIQELENGEESVIEEVFKAETISSNNLVFKLNELENLILWGNIYGKPNSSAVLQSSQTTVRITVSYAGVSSVNFSLIDNTTVIRPFGLINLYDSKCRNCKNGNTASLEDKCEIDGVCYDEWEKDPENVDNVCIPGTSGWTFIDPRCNGTFTSWTNWFSLDDPSGDGDIETFSLSPNGYGCLKESVLNDIRVKNSSLSVEEAGQVVHVDDCFGFMCLNKEQPDGSECFDYEIRQCCPNSYWTTTTATTQETRQTGSTISSYYEEEETSHEDGFTETSIEF